MIWDRTYVVVGMSFDCETDQFLLAALARVEDDLPIGESTWIILNPDPEVLKLSANRIRSVLPRCKVFEDQLTLDNWLQDNMPELTKQTILAF